MIRRLLLALAVLAPALLMAGQAGAIRPDEMLPDPAQEERAREVGKLLRCLVCQNQSIDDSEADLARDLRLLVRDRIRAGDSDAEVLRYMQARYGDFVLMRPPVRPATWLLWFGPLLLALLALGAALLYFRRNRGGAAPPPLSEAERRRLDDLLDESRG